MMESARKSERKVFRQGYQNSPVSSAKMWDWYEKERAERNGAISGKGEVDHTNQ